MNLKDKLIEAFRDAGFNVTVGTIEKRYLDNPIFIRGEDNRTVISIGFDQEGNVVTDAEAFGIPLVF